MATTKDPRQQVLEEFLGQEVGKFTLGVYFWHEKYYEVLPYQTTLKRHNWSGFVRREHKGKFYMIREASIQNIKKWYPKLFMNKDFQTAIKLDPKEVLKFGVDK